LLLSSLKKRTKIPNNDIKSKNPLIPINKYALTQQTQIRSARIKQGKATSKYLKKLSLLFNKMLAKYINPIPIIKQEIINMEMLYALN
jgi:hypothetical protein